MNQQQTRKILVVLPGLTKALRDRTEAAARKYGFSVAFFERVEAAKPFAHDAEIILSASAELAGAAPQLNWLCTPSAGVNQFTAPNTFCAPHAVLSNSTGAYGVTIAEHVVMTLLMLLRRQTEYAAAVAQKQWLQGLPIRAVKGSSVMLLGCGDIGQETAKRLRAFEPAVLVGVNRSGSNPHGLFDRVVSCDEMDSLLPQTDVLICSLPGTLQTHHLLNQKRLSLLKDGAVLINVGRGSVVDEQSLAAELRSGRLYAALDVFAQEPLAPNSDLWDCPNLLITPHIAGGLTLPYTCERVVDLFLADLERYSQGLPPQRAVALERGY